jgi:hypothetical protein
MVTESGVSVCPEAAGPVPKRAAAETTRASAGKNLIIGLHDKGQGENRWSVLKWHFVLLPNTFP